MWRSLYPRVHSYNWVGRFGLDTCEVAVLVMTAGGQIPPMLAFQLALTWLIPGCSLGLGNFAAAMDRAREHILREDPLTYGIAKQIAYCSSIRGVILQVRRRGRSERHIAEAAQSFHPFKEEPLLNIVIAFPDAWVSVG